MTFQLPEKDYFTRKELSERWQCDLSLVDYYIEHGDLREAFRSSAAAFFGLQTTRYYKCDEQSQLFDIYSGNENFKLKIADLLKYLKIEEPDYFGNELVGCPEFIYYNRDPAMKYEYLELDASGYPNYTSVFLYLSGMGSDRYIPAESANAGFGEINVANLEYEETMNNYLVIPKEERDRFESLHTQMVLTESDRSAHEAAEGPIPSSPQAVGDSKLSNCPYWQELEHKAERAIVEFPDWRTRQQKVQKTGNLQAWLTETIDLSDREAEIVKKVLSGIFLELQ